MKALQVLLKRDIRNSFSKRFFILLFFSVLFQFWFVLTSNSINEVKQTGEMFYMAAVFSFNFFGSIVALALGYDGIANEREAKFLDLILTSGVSKNKVYASKVLTSLIISGIFALIYTFVLMLIYLIMTGDIAISLLTIRYALPVTAFLSVFSLMGLMLSVILRSSKASLITSVMVGFLLMPRLFVMIVDGIGSLLGLSGQAVEIIYMISPALIMNALNGYSGTTHFLWGLLLLVVYLAAIIITGFKVFEKQDELNYGE